MRIYHLDLKIAMFRETWIRDWFRRLAEAGYHGVSIEIDNKLVFPSHPDFAAPDALSPDRWRRLVRYGKRLGLSVYPLVQTLGHMEHVLQPGGVYRTLAEIPGGNYLLCPSKPSTRAFVADLIRDVYEVFDHPERIHLGGDECRGAGTCPLCSGRPVHELLAEYMHFLHDQAWSLGMRPEFWADMVLAHPQLAGDLSRDARLVDWRYDRIRRRTLRDFYAWGARDGVVSSRTPAENRDRLPEELAPVTPYMVDAGGRFDPFYGARFLKDQGYDLVLGSAVRFAGDTYFLPRTRTNILNVGLTDRVADELDADHLVTSWAVRLSHPETTWPGLLSRAGIAPAALRTCGAPIGGLDSGLLRDLTVAQAVLPGIDNTLESDMRFQRPFDGNWLKCILALRDTSAAAKGIQRLDRRIERTASLLKTFERRRIAGIGERRSMEHWIDALRLGALRARQTRAVLDVYRGEQPLSHLKPFIEENRALRKDFRQLWRTSLTPFALERECEIKFHRDIRALETLLGQGKRI